jgi:hypothetical protein
MRVREDDAIGLLPAGISHAECGLVRMLELVEPHEPKHGRDSPSSARPDSRLSHAQWSELLRALDHDNDAEHRL